MKTRILRARDVHDPQFYGDEWKLELIEANGLQFWVRPDTSDAKAVKEVVDKKAYGKYGFGPIAGETWLDIGANIGAFTVWAAAHGVEVHAFEPDPVSRAITRMNVRANHQRHLVHVYGAALVGRQTDEVLQLSVNAARGNFWRNSLYHQWRGGFLIDVKTVELDRFLRRLERREPKPWPACLKIDAEGAEMDLIEHSDLNLWGRCVLEWSFDIDRSVPRFTAAMDKLRARWPEEVRYGKFDEMIAEWPPSWFPPTRMIYCGNPAK